MRLWFTAFAAALGGLLFGYDWVVIGGAKPFFERYFQLHSATVSGWANSCALLGCLLGALIAGAVSDRFGRKRPLLAAALLFVVTSLGNALAGTFTIFVAWRILGGVAIGLASSLSPMYISEIAPAHLRGRMVAINQLTIVIGVLLAQVVNWAVVRHLPAGADDAWIATSWYGQSAWRWMFGLTAMPASAFALAMFSVPESPRWLATQGRQEEARAVLARVGGEAHGAESLAEMDAMPRMNDHDRARRATTAGGRGDVPGRVMEANRPPPLKPESATGTWRELGQARLRPALVLGIVLAVFQQWCGINVIFNYAEEIFRAAGYDVSSVLANIAWTGSVNLVFTFVAMAFVDRGGRRPLMLFGAASLAIIYGVMGLCYHASVHGLAVLLLVLAAIACYAMSLAPVTWVVIAEIFPNQIRGAAMSVSVTALWLACFILTFTFPMLNQRLGAAGTFWLYAAICVLGFLFIRRRLPETKGKSLEELEKELLPQQ